MFVKGKEDERQKGIMWHLCWPLWLGLAGGTFAPPDWKLQKVRFYLFLTSSAHLVGCGWGVSVVLSGIFIVGKVPTLPKCASTRVASILPAPELPQAFRHQPIEIFSAPTKPIFSAPTKPIFFGTEPSSRFLVIFTALRFSCSLLPNQQQISEVSENKLECNYSWWKKT